MQKSKNKRMAESSTKSTKSTKSVKLEGAGQKFIARNFVARNQQEMEKIAANIAKTAKLGDCFALIGDLGAGKTCFARGFISSLQSFPVKILSPTFNLVYSYEINCQNRQDLRGARINHFDLYRLKSTAELENIGFFAALENSITLIEWPQIAAEFLPENLVLVNIQIVEKISSQENFSNPKTIKIGENNQNFTNREILISDGR